MPRIVIASLSHSPNFAEPALLESLLDKTLQPEFELDTGGLLARILEDLPAWTPWVSLPYGMLVCFVLAWAGVGFSSRLARAFAGVSHMPGDAHWSMRARVWAPVRSAADMVLWIGVILATGWGLLGFGDLSPVPVRWRGAAFALCVLFGGVRGALDDPSDVARAVRAWPGARRRRASAALLSTIGFPTVLLLANFIATPHDWTPWAWIPTVVVNLLLIAIWSGAYRGGFVAWIGARRAAPPALQAAADDACNAVGIARVPAHLTDLPVATAGALPATREVFVTELAYDALERDELVAVLRHEAAHLADPPSTRRSRLVRQHIIVSLPLAFTIDLWLGLAVGLVHLLHERIVRADSLAAERRTDAGADPGSEAADVEREALTRGLERLHALSLVPARHETTSTHPDLVERGAVVEESRAPSQSAYILPSFITLVLIALVGRIVPVGIVPANESSRRAIVWRVAVTAGRPVPLAALADHWVAEAEFDSGRDVFLFLAATHGWPYSFAQAGIAEAFAGREAAADRYFAAARDRLIDMGRGDSELVDLREWWEQGLEAVRAWREGDA